MDDRRTNSSGSGALSWLTAPLAAVTSTLHALTAASLRELPPPPRSVSAASASSSRAHRPFARTAAAAGTPTPGTVRAQTQGQAHGPALHAADAWAAQRTPSAATSRRNSTGMVAHPATGSAVTAGTGTASVAADSFPAAAAAWSATSTPASVTQSASSSYMYPSPLTPAQVRELTSLVAPPAAAAAPAPAAPPDERMGSPPLPPLTAPPSKGMSNGSLDGGPHSNYDAFDTLSTEEEEQPRSVGTGSDASRSTQQISPPHTAAAHRLSHSHSFPSSAPASVARTAPHRRISYDRDTLEDDEGEGESADTALRRLRFEDQLSPDDQLPTGSPPHVHVPGGEWASKPPPVEVGVGVAAQLPPADELHPPHVHMPSPDPSRPPVHNAQPQMAQQPRLQTGVVAPPAAASAALAAVHHSRAVSAPEFPSMPPAVAEPAPFSVAPPGRIMPSVPDLSSYSSANLEEEEAAAAAAAAADAPPSRTASPDLAQLFGFTSSRKSVDASSSMQQSFSSSAASMQPHDTLESEPPAPFPARNLKLLNFQRLIAEPSADLALLRRMSWSGIPAEVRGPSWKLLLGYLPANADRRTTTLQKRRDEYARYLRDFYYVNLSPEEYYGASASASHGNLDASLASGTGPVSRSESEHEVLKQIRQDVPRTSPGLPFFKRAGVQRALERALYIFAIRHPASGYVQGINDLITPFFTCFMLELWGVDVMADDGSNDDHEDAAAVPEWLQRGAVGESERALLSMEADAYWCMSQLIDSIQDHYTFAQPGIQRMVYRLQELILRIDGNAHTTAGAGAGAGASSKGTTAVTTAPAPRISLHAHLERENVQFIHFAFRWMGCLLMRELRLPLIFRLWDSYLSEGATVAAGFNVLHVYVCAAFLMRWSEQLKRMDFQQIIQFLQKLPTDDWTAADVESLLAQAHIYKTLFHASPQHLA